MFATNLLAGVGAVEPREETGQDECDDGGSGSEGHDDTESVLRRSVAPPMDMVIWAMTTPAMALANDVPRERIRVLKLLAAPVSDGGTAPMMRAGIAP